MDPRAREESRRRDPDYPAVFLDGDVLKRSLLAAAPGSLEEAVLAAICSYPSAWGDDGDRQEVASFVLCRRVWEDVRSRLDPARHRRFADLDLRLPFPASQALVCFPLAAIDQAELHEEGARIAAEILASFPDEDGCVLMTLETARAELLLRAGHEEAHFHFERVMREYAHDWWPVVRYCRALQGRSGWKRVREVLERALREPEKDCTRVEEWDPEELLGFADRHLSE